MYEAKWKANWLQNLGSKPKQIQKAQNYIKNDYYEELEYI